MLAIVVKAALMLVNAAAILNEERFLTPRGWGFADISAHGRQTIKGQIIGFIHAVQYLRVPLIFVNIVAIIFMFFF